MANYVRQTWVDGDPSKPTSAARLGVIEQGIFDAHFQPAARVFHSANQSITTSAGTALAFDSERFDTDTIHDTVTNNSRLTCKTAGKYQVTGSISFASNVTGLRQVFIRLNGTTAIAIQTAPAVSGSTHELTVSTLWDFAVNDYVELMAFQSSGGNLNVTVTSSYSPEFMMSRVA